MAESHVVVIGAGVTGLQTALFLLDAGYDVTIVAKHLPGDLDIDYASPWAGAHWRTHAAPHETEICAWDAETYAYWLEMVAAEARGGAGVEKSGLKLFESRYYWDTPTPEISSGATSLWWRHTVHDFAVLPTSTLPPGIYYGVIFTSFCINVPAYLTYLLRGFVAKGGKVVRRELPADRGLSAALRAAEECVGDRRTDCFVNATGLGARKLVGDSRLFSTRGQTVLVRGEASAARTRVGEGYIAYCIPRAGSGMTVLGGTKEVGSWNKEVDKGTTEAILRRAKVLGPELLNAEGEFDVVSERVGFRPSREGGPRVELEEIDGRRVVHSYGHSGAGYQNSVGCARKVLRLVESSQISLKNTAKL